MSDSLRVFLLPDLGEGLTEAELVTWLVAEGDTIVVDQPIAEVETAKSMVEVPSPYGGVVVTLHGAPGETLDVGKPLISVGSSVGVGSGSSADDAAPAPTLDGSAASSEPSSSGRPDATPGAASSAAAAYREEERAGSGNVLIGYGTPGGASSARRSRAPRGTAANTAVPAKVSSVISPLVRKLARENGVALDSLAGSGSGGLIMRRDVEARIAAPETAAAAGVPAAGSGTAGEMDTRTGLGVVGRVAVRGVRKAVAANMARSRSEIPEATVWLDVDATALVQMRAELKAQRPDATPGLLAFIARFVVAGLKKYPELNTRFETLPDGSQEIVQLGGVNLGFAAQTDRGLVVPSVRNADALSALELDAEIRRLTEVARSGKGTPAELGGGSFTLNNYGVFGVDGSAAIINHPEVAMLGVGRIIDRPWVVNGELAVRKVTELTLVFDHRVCDGGTASGFLNYVASAIQTPATVLADL
ncbi:dihydrolipoamide acetyltransferase family protein [Pseudarthrobacter sp. J1738]|uniref:dihydrolipoamide acetyltransferase family protein n=1 Tax=Pseudarthrobacter sp. J1738 TaxID=3420446 RepID=UPI003D2DF397